MALNCTHWALNNGRMEEWKNGIVEEWKEKTLITLHYSNIPTFQFLLSCITKKEHNHHQIRWISNSN